MLLVTARCVGTARKACDGSDRGALQQQFVDDIFDGLVTLTHSASATDRRHAAMGLDAMRDPKGFDPLVRMLEDRQRQVQAAAAAALCEAFGPAALEPLCQTWQGSPCVPDVAGISL